MAVATWAGIPGELQEVIVRRALQSSCATLNAWLNLSLVCRCRPKPMPRTA